MRIVISARVLNERRGGPFRCVLNFIKHLSLKDKKNEYIILLYDKFNFKFKLPENFSTHICSVKSKLFFDYIYLPLYSYINKIDLFLFPKNTFSPFVKGKKVLFFHDIIYHEKLLFREFKYFDNLHHLLMIPLSEKFSAANLTFSRFTEKRMIELLKIKKEKIKVIHQAAEDIFKVIKDEQLLRKTLDDYNIKEPFFFYAGSLSPRKNMLNILKAFILVKDDIDHQLYVTGGYSWRDNQVTDFIYANNLQERVIKLGFVTDQELIALYNQADCYLYPSFYEGFGLPILEAQACGCPVITSNVGSCPEIAGTGALIVDPHNVDDIADAMIRVVTDDLLRADLISLGFENSAKFSWDKASNQLLSFFDTV